MSQSESNSQGLSYDLQVYQSYADEAKLNDVLSTYHGADVVTFGIVQDHARANIMLAEFLVRPRNKLTSVYESGDLGMYAFFNRSLPVSDEEVDKILMLALKVTNAAIPFKPVCNKPSLTWIQNKTHLVIQLSYYLPHEPVRLPKDYVVKAMLDTAADLVEYTRLVTKALTTAGYTLMRQDNPEANSKGVNND